MKHLRRKTEAEKQGKAAYAPMSVTEYNAKHYSGLQNSWHCDACGILFEPDDDILVKSQQDKVEPLCPRRRRLGWPCHNRLLTATDSYWLREYHVSPVE